MKQKTDLLTFSPEKTTSKAEKAPELISEDSQEPADPKLVAKTRIPRLIWNLRKLGVLNFSIFTAKTDCCKH